MLSDLAVTEEYHAYPGPHLLAALKENAGSGDAAGTLALATRITNASQTRSFRQHGGDWSLHEEGAAGVPDLLPPFFGQADARRPYFETLIVTGVPATNWPGVSAEWRKLRRPINSFIYEPVLVGSFEDAFCATILNPNLAAVVINEGFSYRSRHDAPVLRTLTASMGLQEVSDVSAVRLAHVLKRVRPELDVYLMSNRDVEEMAGNPQADVVRRIFYSVEELLELHLAILEGVQDRYETPFFDNLKKYAQRPIGTFHALPIARGKSVFKSDWIRDMGEFYGPNLFLAESSATTGGLDSLLEPTGNIKKAREGGARVWSRPGLLRYQRHLDIEQDGGAGAGGAGRYRDRRPQLPQVAPLRNGARRRAAALCRSLPDDGIFDVRRSAAADDQAGPVEPQGGEQVEPGQDGRSDELHLRRPYLQRAAGHGGMPCHQA